MVRKGGSRDRYTGLQDVSLMEAAKFSREFDGLIGSRKKRTLRETLKFSREFHKEIKRERL